MSERQHVIAPLKTTALGKPVATVLRRRCACGASVTSGGGECSECKRKKLQAKLIVGDARDAEEREADRVAGAVAGGSLGSAAGALTRFGSIVQRSSAETGSASADAGPVAPPIVHQVLSESGEPLGSGARTFFEGRLGRDFSSVRVHTDAQAAASARAVDAHAYTVGNHVVFGASRYAPDTPAGRRLLAHELTHVVQQGAPLRRASMSLPIEGEGHRDDEDEATLPVQRLQRHVAIVGLDEAGPNADLTGKRETEMYQLAERDKKLAECKKTAAPDPALCDPATPPDWGQFTGTPAAGSSFGAMTSSFIKSVDVPSQKCEQSITGSASGPVKRFQGVFTPASSWVKPMFSDAADPAKNGSAAKVADCEAYLGGLSENQTGWWALSKAQPAGCAASSPARGDRATKKADCAAVITKDFTDTAVKESMRLLKHEQTHLALTCAMAKKGNDLLTSGTSYDKINAVIHTRLSTAQSQYDTQSQHGCVAAQQASWEKNIADGLPAIKLT